MKNSRIKLVAVAAFFLLLAMFSGCAIPKNITDSVYGSYAGGLRSQDVKGISQVVELEIGDCFEKILGVLKS